MEPLNITLDPSKTGRDARSLESSLRRMIVGQDEVIDQVLVALFVGGHCLITGLPGTAKTLLVRTLSQALGLEFRRIQFTPDLMPSDITGTDIIEEEPGTGRRTWTFVPGPIFANVLLADEVHQRGTVDHTPVYPREVVKRALELGASALILVHNHPSGDPTPSRADIAMTREISIAAKALKIDVHDHLVIGRGKHASFKALGLL